VVAAGALPPQFGRASRSSVRATPSSSSGELAEKFARYYDQAQQRRLRPVQVLQGDHQRPPARQVPEQLADRPGGLLRPADRVGKPNRGGDPAGDLTGLLLAGEQGGQLAACLGRGVVVASCRLADDLGDRPVGDALAVGQAAAAQDGGPFADVRQRLVHQPGFAEPGGAQHGDQPAGPLADHPVEHVKQPPALQLAADHGTSRRRLWPRLSDVTARSRHAATRSALPLTASGATGSAWTASRTSRQVMRPSSTSPAAAACSRRAATLTASPSTSALPTAGLPAKTSPVFTPTRTCSVTPQSRSSSSLNSARAVRSSNAARTARKASSSCNRGMPKTPTTASPMNFATVPSWRSSTSRMRS
jgi:hypothetical protein